MTSTISSSTDYDTSISPAEAGNRARFEVWLRALVRDAGAHARLVNTLSMLEHVGSVKIANTQGGMAITNVKLQHLAEETRHAQVLKKIAARLDAATADHYADALLLAGPSARMYFARLDAGVRSALRAWNGCDNPHEAAYLLVTLLVEQRAAWLYPLYQSVVDEAGLRISVRAIIGEEDRHLADVEQGLEALGLAGTPIVNELIALESAAFVRLSEALYKW